MVFAPCGMPFVRVSGSDCMSRVGDCCVGIRLIGLSYLDGMEWMTKKSRANRAADCTSLVVLENLKRKEMKRTTVNMKRKKAISGLLSTCY